MTDDYCKLASGIILSTIWREDDHTRILWITMLAVKGRDHRVLASVPGLAAVANIPIESCRAGLKKLMTPDPDSRTKDHEGRRIAEVDGGWMVLNGEKYRNFLSKQERNEYQARLMADRRAAEKLAPVSKKLAVLAQAEAEAEAEAVSNTEPGYHKDSRTALFWLNEESGHDFQEVDSNLSLISARLNEPWVDIEGVKKMISHKCAQWKYDPKMKDFLRPSTLFRKSKFEEYYASRESTMEPQQSLFGPGAP